MGISSAALCPYRRGGSSLPYMLLGSAPAKQWEQIRGDRAAQIEGSGLRFSLMAKSQTHPNLDLPVCQSTCPELPSPCPLPLLPNKAPPLHQLPSVNTREAQRDQHYLQHRSRCCSTFAGVPLSASVLALSILHRLYDTASVQQANLDCAVSNGFPRPRDTHSYFCY